MKKDDKVKTIQIDERLFARLYSYHVLGKTDAQNAYEIKKGLEERMGRFMARIEYAEKHGHKQK